MTDHVVTAGIDGTFPYRLRRADGSLFTPFGIPKALVYSDAAKTQVAVPEQTLAGSGDPYLGAYPASLPAGVYPLTITTVLTEGEPPYVDGDDRLILQLVDGTVGAARLVSLERTKRHLSGLSGMASGHDEDLEELIEAATPVVEELAGPVLPRQVTQTIDLIHDGVAVLDHAPVLSIAGVTRGTSSLTGWELDGPAGLLRNAHGLLGATVTYTAGRAAISANIRRAALTYVHYWWRRDKGKSEVFSPGGADAAVVTPMGVTSLERQLEHILGPDLRGPRVGGR